MSKPTYNGARDAKSKQIIFEQVISVGDNMFKGKNIDFDEDNANWVVFPDYYMPIAWKGIARTSPLMITFPMEYPRLPPVGFYLKADLPRSPNGHLYDRAYHDANPAPMDKNWRWYCVFIEPQNWKPSVYKRQGDWNRGDNLWDYMTLIGEALQGAD